METRRWYMRCRCTGAVGPSCDCPCGGVNHGSGLLVLVEATTTVPRLTPPGDGAAARARAEAYRAAVAGAVSAIAPTRDRARGGGGPTLAK